MISDQEKQKTEELLRESLKRLKSNLPKNQDTLRKLDAFIENAKPGNVFMWAPVVEGQPVFLPEWIEEACSKALQKALSQCRRKVQEHIASVQEFISDLEGK